jgi:hypothetical protein
MESQLQLQPQPEAQAKSQRRSNIVTLTLIGLPVGAVVLGNIIPAGQTVRRNLYADRTACERDYGPEHCQSSTSGSSGLTSSSVWYGPYYFANRSSPEARTDPGPGRGVAPRSGVETSTRGGFGAFGRTMSATG